MIYLWTRDYYPIAELTFERCIITHFLFVLLVVSKLVYIYSAGVVTCEWETAYELSSFSILSLLVGCRLLWSVTLEHTHYLFLEFCWSFIVIIWWFIILCMLLRLLNFPLRVWNYFYEMNELCEVTFLNMYYFLFYIKSRDLWRYIFHIKIFILNVWSLYYIMYISL